MTDFSKQPDPQDPNQPPAGPPPGYGPPPQGYGQPPQGYPPPQGYGPPQGYPPPQGGGYPPAPPPSGGYPVPNEFGLPDGVELASRGRRIGAYFLAIPLVIVTLVIGYLIWGLILWGKGTSPALKVLGMKCYKPATREVASFGTMALRDIVGGIATGILGIITELVSFVLFLSNSHRKSLADMIGGTVVVYDPNNVLGPR